MSSSIKRLGKMNAKCCYGLLTGVALMTTAVESVCAEVYDFSGWKISITPKADNALPVKKADVAHAIQLSTLPTNGDEVRTSSRLQNPLVIRPASFNTNEGEARPAPIPPVPSGESEVTRLQTQWEYNGEPAVTPVPAEVPPVAPASVPVTMNMASQYQEIYLSIPFSRVEYNANPSYRHDATMEILFGQMRPTVVYRTPAPVYNYYDSGSFFPQQPYYPYSYGLRIHRSR